MAELDDVGAANRELQLAIEYRRAARTALGGIVSAQSELDDADNLVEQARAEANRRWTNASFWRMVDGFAP